MVIVSGILLDYDTDNYVNNATVYATTATGGSVVDSSSVDPVGMFSLDVPTNSGDITYYAVSSDYDVSYSLTYKPYNPFINLFVRSPSSTGGTVSGGAFSSVYNSMLSTSPKVNDLVSTISNVYVATAAGLDIIDVNTNTNVGYVNREGGFTSLALSSINFLGGYLYLGTTNSGVFELELPVVYDINNRDYTNDLSQKYKYATSGVTSDSIMCMHMNSQDDLIIGTEDGVDYYTNSGTTRYYLDYVGVTGTDCCFISQSGDLYYSPTGSGLHVKYGEVTSNWTSPDYSVVKSGTGVYPFPLVSNYLNEVVVTTESGGNHVFIASISGLMYYTEDSNLNVSASGAVLITNYP